MFLKEAFDFLPRRVSQASRRIAKVHRNNAIGRLNLPFVDL